MILASVSQEGCVSGYNEPLNQLGFSARLHCDDQLGCLVGCGVLQLVVVQFHVDFLLEFLFLVEAPPLGT